MPVFFMDVSSFEGAVYGSQSSLIADYLRERASQRKVALYAFVEEMAASGGFLLACAADAILVSKSEKLEHSVNP